jgi:hypothetical protein
VHPWSGSKPYGSPPGREESVAPAVDNGHKRRFDRGINSDKVFGTHLDFAGQDPPVGVSRDEAIAEIMDVLDSIGDTCPECPPEVS